MAGNDALASWSVLADNRFPFADATFGVCVSNYVVEHVENTREHLSEISRVLAPGGAYIFRTPNLYHYVGLAAHFTPHRFRSV